MSDERYYEGYASNRGGYGYVDLRGGDGGETVLGANGEGGYTPEQAQEIAGLLNAAMEPANGLGRIDVTAEQAAFLRSLLRAAEANNALEYEGGDLPADDFHALVVAVDMAVDQAGMDASGPRP